MKEESKNQIKEYMDKMLKANEIGIELDLFVNAQYSTGDGGFIGFKLFLAEHKAMREISPLIPSNHNYVMISLNQVLNKEQEVKNMIDYAIYDKFGDQFDMTEEEDKEVELYEKNINREFYEEKWLNELLNRVDEKLEFIK